MATIADISASIMGLFYVGYLSSYWVRLRSLGSLANSNLPFGGYWPTDWTNILNYSKKVGLQYHKV